MVVDGATVRDRALDVLTQAATSADPRLRANAIEALRYGPDVALRGAVLAGIADENRGVRFVATMLIGDAELCDLGSLLEPLLMDDAASVRAAAMCSLYRCGDGVDLSSLAVMLASDDPELRANAALVLGAMGNESAIPMLREAVRLPMRGVSPIRRRLVNLQLAEALVRLGAREELEVVRAAIFSSAEEAEATALACQIAGRLRDVDVASNLQDLAGGGTPARQPAEVRLVAAAALAQIDPNRMPTDVVLRFTTHYEPSLRAQAAVALGLQGNTLSLGPLALLIGDDDPLVQVAAAGAALRIDGTATTATAD